MRDLAELIRRYCRDRDEAAFREFFRTQSPRLWKYLVARGCNSEDAYDLVAETFARFFQNVCRDPSSPVALLYRIAVNLRIDVWRRERASPVDVRANPDHEPVASDSTTDEDAAIRQLVAQLPEREQNLLLLRYWIGMSHKEIAEVLAQPEGTVRRQCSEALAMFRERWERHGG
jgi:RNA polymerase sigma factor (sigma-70 family)